MDTDAPGGGSSPWRASAELGSAAPARAALGVRWRARLRRAQLDRLLARGADPLTKPELQWRARQLTSRRNRRRLAKEIERVLDAAKTLPLLGGSAAPLNRVEIAPCRELLEALASDLRGAEPVALRGMALTAQLLHDGCSPLYAPHPPPTEGELETDVRRARAALVLR